jgi:hypothetical protein
MSETDLAVEAIEAALSGQLEGVDTERIVSELLFKLNADYEATQEAAIQDQTDVSGTSEDPGWEADFENPQDGFGYQMCPSDSDEDAPDESFGEFVPMPEPAESTDAMPMTQAHKDKIIAVMSRIQLRVPLWLQK